MALLRRYDDACGAARALDVVGERWSLLAVRELLYGPKRFGQLKAGLPGVSPNVLVQRLRDLESAGVLRHEVLPPPASVAVYALTDRGRALEPVLLELVRWGAGEPVGTADELSVNAFVLALRTACVAPPTAAATYGLGLGEEWFTVEIADGVLTPGRGPADAADATLAGSVAAVRAYASGRAELAELESRAELTTAGNRTLVRLFPRLFRMPAGS